ncbi:MAG: hypothetical protein Q8N53_08350 [Longimicrobiales bacterium]|nr:hypothetical protein [Longimicrobiales bacterium]
MASLVELDEAVATAEAGTAAFSFGTRFVAIPVRMLLRARHGNAR